MEVWPRREKGGLVTPGSPVAHPAIRRWLVPLVFSLIIVEFAVGNLAALMSARRVQAANRSIGQNAIVSIGDLSRIVHDIDLERLLIDQHIFESRTEQMLPIESRLSEVDTDLASL